MERVFYLWWYATCCFKKTHEEKSKYLKDLFKKTYITDVVERYRFLNDISVLDTFIICKAERYDIQGRKYIGSQLKCYFTDMGLRNARLNFWQQEENHITENILFNELMMREFDVNAGVIEYKKPNLLSTFLIHFKKL